MQESKTEDRARESRSRGERGEGVNGRKKKN